VDDNRRMLLRCHDWTNTGGFKAIDYRNDGFVDHEGIKRFLRRNGHFATDTELVDILRRMDIDNDSKVYYDEFIEGMREIFSESGPLLLPWSSPEITRYRPLLPVSRSPPRSRSPPLRPLAHH
jgi:hypothetical protein